MDGEDDDEGGGGVTRMFETVTPADTTRERC